MKSLQTLYTEILGSDELKKAYLEAAKGGKVAEFLRAQGCDATAEEVQTFLASKADQELSDDELDSVAGGGCNLTTKDEATLSVCTAGLGCAAMAIESAVDGHTGQQTGDEGRLCTKSDKY